jgi:membrane protease subunit (stomatin/prohibitin family)
MLAELKECMVLLPQASAGMGMGMGMLRPMLGQMRTARDQMRALPPEEQDELAARMAEELKDAPADERRQFLEAVGSGFLPPRVVDGLRSRLGSR